MRQIFLDTETTGLDVKSGHRIVEIAAVEVCNRQLTGRHFHYYCQGNGNVNLVFEAWVNGGPQIFAQWPMPLASIGGGSHIPEAGDIIRVRWEQLSGNQLNVKARYYDASTATWHTDVINYTVNLTNIGGINFTDGWLTASSITIDSNSYSIRRYKAGTLATYP